MNLKIKKTSIEEIPFCEPVKYFEKYGNYYYSAILSGKGHPDITEYSFIGFFPHTILRYRKRFFEIEREDGTETIRRDFWDYLHEVLRSMNFCREEYPANLCGAIGYFSYEGFHTIEKIDSPKKASYEMPVMEIVFYNHYAVFDHKNRRAYKVTFNYEKASSIKIKEKGEDSFFEVKNFRPECSREEYIEKIEKIIDYIIEGDVYEVCLTQEFSGDFRGSPFLLFKKIFKKNPAPFSSFLNYGDLKIVCNSPELFMRCRENSVETRPIKGTAPRSGNKDMDNRNREGLLSSQKDQAELFMIIDLLRNDIGKVCKKGTVKVRDSKRIEAYENVFQLIGIVEGRLNDNKNYIDLLKAVFPGGSITGCPKVRSMEIIEELETYKRNIYTGTIFHLNRNNFVSNIVIRTAVIRGNRIFINSGGAVTIDSDPESEYNETIHKVNNILRIIGYEKQI